MLLAVESSTKSLSVALFDADRLIHSVFLSPESPGTHSENIHPLINRVFQESQTQLNDLTSLAIANGPGSFTSLRVGLAAVLGLAQARSLPIYPVSTLHTLALPALSQSDFVVPILKAGRGEVYAAGYHNQEMMIPEASYQPEDLRARLDQLKVDLKLVGPGVSLMGTTSYASDPDLYPQAQYMGALAFKAQPQSYQDVQIRYLKEPDLG